MSAAEKIARQRLSALQLAETLGSVSKACRQRGMMRTMFCEYKKRFQTHGLEGLKDLPPIHKSHPQTTPLEVVEQVLEWAVTRPIWGCEKISLKLKQAGIRLSVVTVQDILNKHELGKRWQRLFAAEKRHLAGEIALDADVIGAVERNNPCYRERHVESSCAGELLSADTSKIGDLPDGSRLILHVVVDTYGSYGFGAGHPDRQRARVLRHKLPSLRAVSGPQ